MKLLVATKNKGKLFEIQQILDKDNIQVTSLLDYMDPPEIIEDGKTFLENARKKALIIAKHYHLPVLADDSGLEVNCLQNAPGVYSARYAGDDACDNENNDFLLKKLKDIPPKRRDARFVCVMVIATPDGKTHSTKGIWKGSIGSEPKGGLGFGYDPIFIVKNMNRTAAELLPDEKNEISHRGQALKQMLPIIRKLFKK